MDHIFHGGLLRADIEFVLHQALDYLGRILRVDHAGRADAARQELRAVAGVGLHIQHLHSRSDTGESQHFDGLAALIGLPVAIAAIRRSDNGFIIGSVGVLRRGYAPSRKHRKRGKHGNGAGAARRRSDHETPHHLPAT